MVPNYLFFRNVLIPEDSIMLDKKRQKVNYIFTIYRGENVLCDPLIAQKKVIVPNIFIKICFIGVNVSFL